MADEIAIWSRQQVDRSHEAILEQDVALIGVTELNG
jgi:hypothetical protein